MRLIRLITRLLSAFFTLLMISSIGYGQKTFGIIRVFDDRTKIDYSQFVLNLFKEHPLLSADNQYSYKLINHFSQADVAFKVIVRSDPECQEKKCDQLIITSYVNGKRFNQQSMNLKCIDPLSVLNTPQLEMTFEETDLGLYKILSVPEGSMEDQNGLKPDYIFQTVQNDQANQTIIHYKENEFVAFSEQFIEVPNVTTYSFENPLGIGTVDCIFQSIKNYFTLTHNFKPQEKARKFKTSEYASDLWNLKPKKDKVYPKELLPGTYQNVLGANFDTSINLPDYVISKGNYILPSSKKLRKFLNKNTGNAALMNHIYYYEDQKFHKFQKHKEVNDEVNSLVDLYIDPIHNKPGMAINYLLSGEQYFEAGEYPSAINQYNAALKKTNETHTNTRYKLELKWLILERLSSTYDSLSMHNYSKMLSTSNKLLEYKLANSEFSEKYYSTADELTNVCSILEDQIREKKRSKTWGIIGAVASVGSGAALASVTDLSEIGLDMAADFITTGYEIFTNNFELSSQISNSIMETSSSITNLTNDFDLDSDELNDSTHFLSSFIDAYEEANDKERILNIVNQHFSDDSSVILLTKELDPSKSLTDSQNIAVLRELGKLESMVYNYEVRNLSLPDKYKF